MNASTHMDEPRVFVVHQNPKIDVSPARKHGEIVIVLPPGDPNDGYADVLEKMQSKLARFDPDKDAILLVGDPVSIFMAGAVIAEIVYDHRARGRDPDYLEEDVHPYVWVLKWNRHTKEYLKIRVPVWME